MLCGTVPFKASNLEDLHKLILKGDFTFPCELSNEAQVLVRGMIQLEPKSRLTVPSQLEKDISANQRKLFAAMQKKTGDEIKIYDTNHINDPEWLENLEDIKLNGTGKDDVNIMRNFHTAKKELVQ